MTTPVCENREEVLRHLEEVVATIRARLDAGNLRVIALTVASDTPNGDSVSIKHWLEGTGSDALRASDAFQDFVHQSAAKLGTEK